MDTPITLSSSSTVPEKSDYIQRNNSPDNEASVITLGSTSYERVPVSWKSANAFIRSDSNTSLTHVQKVSRWIKDIEEPKGNVFEVDTMEDVKYDSSSENSKRDDVRKRESDSKSVILFRCDFNKSPKPYCKSINSFRSTPLISYLKTDKKDRTKIPSANAINSECIIKSNTNQRVNQKQNMNRAEHKYGINQNDNISKRKLNTKVDDEKSDASSDLYEVPLSPESRKKELCRYLQLMNPADKKERFILQNRRSVRVKNLTAKQEERKKVSENAIIHNGNDDSTVRNVEKCLTLKSFKELNIRVEKVKLNPDLFDKKTSETYEKDIFCFPFPAKNLCENIEDFDNTMAKLVPRFKRICRIKNLKSNYKIGLRNRLIRKDIRKKNNRIKNINRNSNSKPTRSKINGVKSPKKKAKEQKLKKILKKKYEQTKLLRSTGRLKAVSLKNLLKKEERLLNKKNMRKKEMREARQLRTKAPQPESMPSITNSKEISKVESASSQCEIVTISNTAMDGSHIDLENLADDIVDFTNLSEEHKKYLIEDRILSTRQTSPTTTKNGTEEDLSQPSQSTSDKNSLSPLYGFDKADVDEVQKICEIYKNSLIRSGTRELMENYIIDEDNIKSEETTEATDGVEHKTEDINPVERLAPSIRSNDTESDFSCDKQNESTEKELCGSHDTKPVANGVSLQEHDYAGVPSDDDEEDEGKEVDVVSIKRFPQSRNLLVRNCIEISPRLVARQEKFQLLPYDKSVEMKSLHKSLQYAKRKENNSVPDESFNKEWESDDTYKQKSKKQSHYISINKENGAVLKAFYVNYNLFVCQENIVSLWMQTPLGNVLGSQNMWIPRGQSQRLVLNAKCMQKESMEMIIAMETDVAYIELWTKEHKSDIREGPVADVFATVYFWKQRQNGLHKKVLQLENINGFADDVQYSVMKSVPKIIVSWHSVQEDSKKTFIHAYQLAADFQTVANIYNIEPVDHYVSSLHNIEDCDSLIMGCGENKITLWNLEYGYIIATISLSEIKSPLSTLWVKCDRGFLFALQQCVDRELRLIAINGINHTWKKLASYFPPEGFDRLRGVCIENGLVLSFYDQGILCWKAETGEPVEETTVDSEVIPSGKYVIIIEEDQILVKHAMTHLMSMSVDET